MTGKLNNVQALRAVAALLVLMSHLRMLGLNEVWAARLHFPNGAVGVDLFFCISGYIMCLTIDRTPTPAREFILARVARVVPLYFIVNVVVILVHVLRSIRLGRAEVLYPLDVLWNSFFFIPLFDFGAFTDPLNYCGWTLCFEMWFYCLLALFLFCGMRKRFSTTVPFAMLAGVVLLPLYHGSWYLPRFLFNPICLEFAFGCFVYFFEKKLNRPAALACLAISIPVFFLVPSLFHYPGSHEAVLADYSLSWRRTLFWGLPSAILLLGFSATESRCGLKLPAFLVWIGDYSYSLYLVQFITIGAFSALAARRLPLPSFVLPLAFIGGTLFVSWLSWVFVEKPSSAYVKRRLLGPPARR